VLRRHPSDERADPVFERELDEFIDGLRPDDQESATVDRDAAAARRPDSDDAAASGDVSHGIDKT
jgi:hypothetical protein